jgi:hypothetical protein
VSGGRSWRVPQGKAEAKRNLHVIAAQKEKRVCQKWLDSVFHAVGNPALRCAVWALMDRGGRLSGWSRKCGYPHGRGAVAQTRHDAV